MSDRLLETKEDIRQWMFKEVEVSEHVIQSATWATVALSGYDRGLTNPFIDDYGTRWKYARRPLSSAEAFLDKWKGKKVRPVSSTFGLNYWFTPIRVGKEFGSIEVWGNSTLGTNIYFRESAIEEYAWVEVEEDKVPKNLEILQPSELNKRQNEVREAINFLLEEYRKEAN